MQKKQKTNILNAILDPIVATFQKLFLTVFLSLLLLFVIAGSEYSFTVAKAKERISGWQKVGQNVEQVAKVGTNIYKFVK